jgi:DNA-binding MarR family transcriptional regulator
MRNRQRTPLNKLCDIFANVIEKVLTEQALSNAPCSELSRSQWDGILFIQRHQNCSIRHLAEGLSVSHPAAVKLVERLVRKGLITRHESEKDRRVVELNLSPRGLSCVDHVREARARLLEQIMADMPAEATEGLVTGLQCFISAALKDSATAESLCLHCGIEHVPECLIQQATDQMGVTDRHV